MKTPTDEEQAQYGLHLTHVALCRHMVQGCVDQWRADPGGRDMGLLFDLIDRLKWTLRHGFDRPQYTPKLSRDDTVRAAAALRYMLENIDILDPKLPPPERVAYDSLRVRLELNVEDMDMLLRLQTERPDEAPR